MENWSIYREASRYWLHDWCVRDTVLTRCPGIWLLGVVCGEGEGEGECMPDGVLVRETELGWGWKRQKMFVLPHSGVGCSIRLSRPDSPTHFCCGGSVALSASGLQGRYKMWPLSLTSRMALYSCDKVSVTLHYWRPLCKACQELGRRLCVQVCD